MNGTIVITDQAKQIRNAIRNRKHSKALPGCGMKNMSALLIAGMFGFGCLLAMALNIPAKSVMDGYSYDVLVILIMMELFTNLIAETGIMQFLAVKLAGVTKGKRRLCLMMFSGMMFLISSCLNNITAVMLILPIIFVLLNTLEVDKKYVCTFFAAILALSNTGGAASPVGDFPAIVIMTSGVTDFLGYLTHAFPLFAFTSLILTVLWGLRTKKETGDGAVRTLAICNLRSQYKNITVRFDVLKWLAGVFVGMFLAWSFAPQDMFPPEVIAVLGYVAAMVICACKKIRIPQTMDLKPVLTIAAFLFFARVIGQTGLLNLLAAYLQDHISDLKLLVMAIMIITSLAAGVFSAGPAAAALMPVIAAICKGPLGAQSDWIVVAYAAAICAGSSLFMWSATAGFILSDKINDAGIMDSDTKIFWGITEYMKYGIVNYAIQLFVALLIVAAVL